jgi:sec-independent protein translocase protein TatC
MATNSNFNFTNNTNVTLELPFSEHIEELRQRIFLLFWIILLLTCIAFVEVKSLVKILELPISNVKFFQISPGEYFISTIKISFYTGLLFSSPFVIGQLILFLLPGLTKKETKIILPLLIRFINFIWIRISLFLLYFDSSSVKFFFKL